MDLLLIRHAQSFNNQFEHVDLAQRPRQAEPDLTDVGHDQANRLAEAFAAGVYPRPHHLYSSFMLRALQTAAPLADAMDLPLIAHPDAFEVYGPVEFVAGRFDEAVVHPGSPRSVLQAVSDRIVLPEQVSENGWWRGPVEDDRAITDRASRLLADLIERHGDSNDVVAMVSHGTFSHRLIHQLIGVSQPRTFLLLDNTAVTWVSGLGTQTLRSPLPDHELPVVLRYIGRTAHLTS